MSYVDFQDHSENRNVVLSRAHSHEIVAPGPNPRHIKPIVEDHVSSHSSDHSGHTTDMTPRIASRITGATIESLMQRKNGGTLVDHRK